MFLLAMNHAAEHRTPGLWKGRAEKEIVWRPRGGWGVRALFCSIICTIPFSRPISQCPIPPEVFESLSSVPTDLSPSGRVLPSQQEGNRMGIHRGSLSTHVHLCSCWLGFQMRTSRVELSHFTPKTPAWEVRLLLHISECSKLGLYRWARSNSGL